MHIPPFCAGFVPHTMKVSATGVFMGAPGIYQRLGLLVIPEFGTCLGTTKKPDSTLVTPVFNLSSMQIRIRQGEVVSRLLCPA